MKKYFLISILAGSVACSDSFLEEKMVSVITQDYFNTEVGLEQLIVGTYDAYRVSKQYNQGPTSFFNGLDIITSKTANDATYSASSWNATASTSATLPQQLGGEYTSSSLLGYYPIINNCNRAIQTIEEGKALGKFAENAVYAELRKSEALLNRAYCIYILNTLYGDVYIPRQYTQAMPENFNYVRETSESLFRQIIGDLRYAYDHLPNVTELNLKSDFGRGTKQIAAHFLAKLYLNRAQTAKYGTTEYGRNADGTIDNLNEKSYLGMLYKGNVATDLDSCIWFASQVIDNSGYHALEADYRKLYLRKLNDYSEEESKELILSCVYGQYGVDNGRYGNRLAAFIGGDYSNAKWGIPLRTWEKGGNTSSRIGYMNDFGYDLFVNKHADSRYEKSFYIEHTTGLRGGTTPTPDLEYYAYDNANNATYTWTDATAEYFNANILPSYNRESWGGRSAVAGQHKMGAGDIAIAYVENTKETAIDINEAISQPFYVRARWIKDGSKYYYRVPTKDVGTTYEYNPAAYNGIDLPSANGQPQTFKYLDPNRNEVDNYYGSRDVPIFRLAETYLLRAEAYGRKNNWAAAIEDINKVRFRAAYKKGESRAEVLARLQPGHEALTESEQQYPYLVENDMTEMMRVDASFWDGASEASKAESYPPSAASTEDRFVNFILNELAREFTFEMHYYENLHHSGWQAERIAYNNQMASSLNRWDTSDNLVSGKGQNGSGQGSFKPQYTFKAFTQSMINMLTDESGALLDDAAKKAYQNYGY